jgi:hypothetical protein
VERDPVLAQVSRLVPALALLLAVCLVGCGQEQRQRLTATLTSPTDVSLVWEAEPGAAGQVVEYANVPDGDYTVLEFVSPDRTSYEHPDLIPQTPFYYRVRSFHGPASATVDVTLPPGDEVPGSDDHAWAEPVAGPSGTSPVRSADAGPADAGPPDFRAEVKHANGILFTWTDRFAGEEGYLLEVGPSGAADFSVVAQLDPDVRSFGLITLSTEKHATYRVRAYYYGAASNVVHQKTGIWTLLDTSGHCLGQGQIDGSFHVDAGGVDQRHGAVGPVHQQRDLGAAQDHRLRAEVHQACHHVPVRGA